MRKYLLIAAALIVTSLYYFWGITQISTLSIKPNKSADLFFPTNIENPNGRYQQEFLMLRDPVTNTIPKGIFKREMEFAEKLPKKSIKVLSDDSKSAKDVTWSERGPNNIGGRTRALGIDIRTTTAPNITIIAGGVSGGIWKSTDDGNSWTEKTTPGQLHNATCIAQDTRTGHEDTWYVGTGEGLGNSASHGTAAFRGDGIFKSTDNGETWTLLSSTSTNDPNFDSDYDYVHSIEVDNSTGDVYAVTCKNVRKSTDGGATWTKTTDNYYGYGSIPSDVKITSSGVLYAVITNFYISNPSLENNLGVLRSDDGGATWTEIASGVTDFPTKFRRGVIAIAPSNENVVYFLLSVVTSTGASTAGNQLWKYTYVSGDGSGSGGVWENRGGNLPDNPNGDLSGNDPFSTQGGYDLFVKVKPDDENFLIVGGTNLYYSDDAFATNGNFVRIGGYAAYNTYSKYTNHHPDIHAGVFRSGSNAVFYSGDDGGLQRTDDVTASTVSWTKLNNSYNVTQFYSISLAPESGSNIMLGGTQDNGSLLVTSSGNTSWGELLSGDGTITIVAPIADDRYYPQFQNGGLYRVTRTPSNYVDMTPSGRTNPLFVNPAVLDKNNSSLLYVAGGSDDSSNYTGIWRNNDAANATTTNGWTFLTPTAIASTGTPKVSAIGLSQSNSPNVLYYGTSKGDVRKAVNANSTPTVTDVRDANMPAGYVSSIAVNPNNSDKVIVTFSSYNVVSVWYSTDGGANWSDIEGNLAGSTGPSVRWASIFDVGGVTHYFLATSTGLYYTTTLDGSSTVWYETASSSIGNVVCTMLDWRTADNTLAVATHGRGVFTTQISSPLPVELVSFTGKVKGRNVELTWQTATEVNNYGFEVGRGVVGDLHLEWEKIGFVEGAGNSNSIKTYFFTDKINRGGKYSYRLKQIDLNGAIEYSNTIEIDVNVESEFALKQNYPNPFSKSSGGNPTTTIEYSIPSVGTRHALSVQLKIYDVLGREITTLVNKKQSPGNYSIKFNASNLPTGIYFYRIYAGDYIATKKMILMK